MSNIKLLTDIPVSKELGLVKDLVIDAYKFEQAISPRTCKPMAAKNHAWVKRCGKNIKILSHEYELVEANALDPLLDAREAGIRAEGEQRAARKIAAVIVAHKGLNSDSEVLSLVEASLQVIDKLDSEVSLERLNKQGENK